MQGRWTFLYPAMKPFGPTRAQALNSLPVLSRSNRPTTVKTLSLAQSAASASVATPGSVSEIFCASARDACTGADCVVIGTEWQEFRALDAKTLARVMRRRTIVDLRNLLDHEVFVGEGFVVHSIGRPTRLPARMTVAQRRRARGSDASVIRTRGRLDVAHGVAL